MSKKASVRSAQTEPENYDLVILGGSTGGAIAGWTFAKQGQSVAVIAFGQERRPQKRRNT
jgi:choline dehydrogenase-like flavoprotein